MKHLWLLLCGIVLLVAVGGCNRAPSNLGPDYHKGKCVVCKKTTMVKDRLLNPLSTYKIPVCWKDDCQRRFGAFPDKYVDPSHAKPINTPLPGQGSTQPGPSGK